MGMFGKNMRKTYGWWKKYQDRGKNKKNVFKVFQLLAFKQFCKSHSTKHFLFEPPEEIKLTENPAKRDQQNLVNRKDK